MSPRAAVAALLFAAAAVFPGCECQTKESGGGGPVPSGRCEVNLDETGLFAEVGKGALAKVIEDGSDLIGGQMAEGRPGDILLRNDRLRVVISQPGRHFGAVPYGGWIVDADLRRPNGEPGHDQFGKMGFIHAFGRTVNATKVEILNDGSGGGSAVVAATGEDTLNDFIDLQAVIHDFLPDNVELAVDPDLPVSLKATTYYVLSPGESRVRVLTQFCNEGKEIVSVALGDLLERGGTVDFLNPEGCTGQPGSMDCLIDPSHGFGFQGAHVAYGYRSYQFDNLAEVSQDALLNVNGPVAALAGAQSSNGVLTWMDPNAPSRPGTFGIRAGESRGWLRDFFVTRDLAAFHTTLLTLDGEATGTLNVTVTHPDGAPAAGARVGVYAGSRMVTLLVADEDGEARVDLQPRAYDLYVGAPGHAVVGPLPITVGTNGTLDEALQTGETRTLKVTVEDPFGAPLPAKVTVLCPSGTCPSPASDQGRLFEVEPLPTNVAAVGLVPPQGTLDLKVPPGQYEVVVTRGPEYSAWPDAWPASGAPVDLTVADQAVDAVLAHVVDTGDFMSADLHVHSVNSPDSSVHNDERVLTFLAEGVDVLVSTDHDYLTDFAPVIARLGGEDLMASMVGTEISTFTFGHYNAYPAKITDAVHGGPFDWGGGDGPTLRAEQLISGAHEAFPGSVIQLNHPRSRNGVFNELRADTDTLATHADPAQFRMAPHPDATASDTMLLGAGFDAIEVANGLQASNAVLNDWMTQLSAGRRVAATAVSDSHKAYLALGGYSRTYVDLGEDATVAGFDPKAFAAALKGLEAFGTNAPIVRVTARRLDATGAPAGAEVGFGGTVSLDAAAGEKVELTVDVQTPEWIRFDTIEVFTHEDGREALAGEENGTWPVGGVFQSASLDPLSLPLEVVPDQNGMTFRRNHVVQTFELTPTEDTWYVVIVRSSSAVGTLYPLAYDGLSCSGNLCTARAGRPYAFTNPIFVDADQSGAYDTFPQKIVRGIRLPPPEAPRGSPRAPTPRELDGALRELLRHDH